ncbi:MAG: MBOAT family protein [Deltaproteobacteria bacterium]|nr:MBOAT family protein [Deltaproteobacteria bacterium]
MVFSSQIFLFVFLPLALLLCAATQRGPRGLANGTLAALSYLFYGWSNPPFVLLMLFSTLVDYGCGHWLARTSASRQRRAAVTLSIVTNLSLLGFFKYFNLGVEGYNGLMDLLGLGHLAWREVLRVTLPLGISFYTFQSMSYTIDIYRGHAQPARSFVDFACYVSLFSQLVAGPILRFTEVADQLGSRAYDATKFARGVAMLSLGLAKKVLLANPCGLIADTCFGAEAPHTLDAWIGVLAYSFQIYFDFSGYSDMAIGLGLLLGFTFPKNFDAPYRSASISEFWRRWHISLSGFLRDYLYVPLGGSRRGPRRTYVNLMLVMLLGGLWHGAAPTFVIWGALHGVALATERALGGRPLYAGLPRPVQIALTFALVSVAWVFFRAPDLASAGDYLARMAGLGEAGPAAVLAGGVIYQPYTLATLAAAAAITWGGRTSWDWTRTLSPVRAAACLGAFAAACAVLFTQSYNPFIYFIF